MSEESDNMTKEAIRPKSKPRSEPKRQRRNYEGELVALQSRVDMAVKILQRSPASDMTTLAIEVLEGM